MVVSVNCQFDKIQKHLRWTFGCAPRVYLGYSLLLICLGRLILIVDEIIPWEGDPSIYKKQELNSKD